MTDFVAGAESTAGGRLARWLAPTSRVEPSKCELKAPTQPVRPSARLTLPILVRDQYGENVASPSMKVEVSFVKFFWQHILVIDDKKLQIVSNLFVGT